MVWNRFAERTLSRYAHRVRSEAAITTMESVEAALKSSGIRSDFRMAMVSTFTFRMWGMPYIARETLKASSAPERIACLAMGSVIRSATCRGVAPARRAPSSREGSMFSKAVAVWRKTKATPPGMLRTTKPQALKMSRGPGASERPRRTRRSWFR